MITVPKRFNRAVIAGAATAVAITMAAPAASALAATQHGKAGQHHGKAVPMAHAAKKHHGNLKVTG